MSSLIPPRYELPIADKDGHIAREWYKYLVMLGNATGSTTFVDDLQLSANLDSAQTEGMALNAQKTAQDALGLFLLGAEDKKQMDDTSLLAWWPL